jgi:hypothetical protein
MPPSSPAFRTPCALAPSLHHQLNLYALAAGATGVSVLALTQPAEGRVVYTKAHTVIQRGESFKLDLNHDKIVDFTVANFMSCTALICGYFLQVQPTRGNSEIGYVQRFFTYASALRQGFRIDPDRDFKTLSADMVIQMSQLTAGPWVDVSDRYLGLKVQIDGEPHYGWARLSVRVKGSKISATLTGYAYETIASKPIDAGKTKDSVSVPDFLAPTGGLGALALGR